MTRIKIESIINSCNECRYMCRMQSEKGGSIYAAICVYHSQSLLDSEITEEADVESPPDILLMTSLSDSTKHYSIDIPNECPLQDYFPKYNQT